LDPAPSTNESEDDVSSLPRSNNQQTNGSEAECSTSFQLVATEMSVKCDDDSYESYNVEWSGDNNGDIIPGADSIPPSRTAAAITAGALPTYKDQARDGVPQPTGSAVPVAAGKSGALPTHKDQAQSVARPSQTQGDPSVVGELVAIGVHVEEDLPAINEIPVVAVLEAPKESDGSAHRKHVVWAGAVVLIAAIVGVVVGVVLSKSNNGGSLPDTSSPTPAPSVLATIAPMLANVSSTFEQDLDGWLPGGDGVGEVWMDGGYISVTDGKNGSPWYFVAPAKFRGNLVDCSLSFELKQNSLEGQVNVDARVYIGSNTKRVALRDNRPSPGLNFTKYEVVLSPAEFWYNATTLPRTDEQVSSTKVRAILANADYLAIRGEYSSAKDTGSLDNVYLTC